MRHAIIGRTRGVFVLLAALSLAACSSGVTRSDGGKASVFQPTAEQPINQVNVTVSDAVQEKLKDSLKFSSQELGAKIQQALAANDMYGATNDAGVLMSVNVTKVRVRSTFNAVMWGAMAGGDSIEGEVSVKDASGKTLDTFKVSTSYALGGLG